MRVNPKSLTILPIIRRSALSPDYVKQITPVFSLGTSHSLKSEDSIQNTVLKIPNALKRYYPYIQALKLEPHPVKIRCSIYKAFSLLASKPPSFVVPKFGISL